jgi:hypothetical protein
MPIKQVSFPSTNLQIYQVASGSSRPQETKVSQSLVAVSNTTSAMNSLFHEGSVDTSISPRLGAAGAGISGLKIMHRSGGWVSEISMRRVPNGMENSIVLREENVGFSAKNVCYPNISSCITITGVGSNGVVGGHLTILTTASLLGKTMQVVEGEVKGCEACYVIGAISQFKVSVKDSEINTRKKISDSIKQKLGKQVSVLFYDTGPLGEVHIFMERNAEGACQFSYCKASVVTVSAQEYPVEKNKRVIPESAFSLRSGLTGGDLKWFS